MIDVQVLFNWVYCLGVEGVQCGGERGNEGGRISYEAAMEMAWLGIAMLKKIG